MKVFVYGTLKAGYWNNPILRNSNFIGEGLTTKKYILQDCGFPYAIPENYAEDNIVLPIIGEVWEVDDHTLRNLDRLEGEGSHYHRRPCNIIVRGNTVLANIYEHFQFSSRLPICPTTEVDGEEVYVWSRSYD